MSLERPLSNFFGLKVLCSSCRPSKSKVTPGSDPHASEFVPRSAIESTDTHMAAVSSHINPMPWESSDGDSQISVSSSTVPSKINADEAKALSLVKSVWEQPSPEAERDSTARPTNSLDSLMMMDDFPSALPSMADLRSDDGMSAPSSRNLSPVSQGATALPVDASSSSGSHYLHSTLSGLPQQHSPNQGSALPAYRPSSTGHPQKPLNKMPLPGVKSPNSSYGAGLSNGSPYQQPTSQPNQSTLPPPPSSYPAPNFNNNNFSNINPAFSSGIWMPIGQSPPQRASQPNGIAPINTFTSMTPGSNAYPHSDQPNGYPSRGYGSSPRSPGALPFSQHNGPQQYPYGAFAQPSGLSPFPGAVGSGHLGYPHLFPQQQPNAPPPPGNFRKHW